MVNKSTDHIGSLSKGLKVLAAFSAAQPRLSITEASHATGLDRATARRCLLTLHHDGYATYDGKYFALTTKALRLGAGVLAALSLPQIVQPWLDQLSEKIGQSVSVAVRDGREIVYVARAAQKRVMSIGLHPGSRLPAHCSSLGRVLLAALPDEEVQNVLASSDLTPNTPLSLSSESEIMAEIAKVRAQSFALVDQEIEMGLRSLAVPLRNHAGKTVAALNVGLATIHAKATDMIDLYLEDLQRVQAGVAEAL